MTEAQTNILLADDDSAQRKLLVQALVECAPDLNITTVDSGEALFQRLAEGTYDCLVLDCNMPPLGPSEIIGAPQVRASGCSVVAVSNSEDQSVVIESLRGGAVDFVPKSDAVHGTVLWKCVQKAIQRKQDGEIERRQIEARQQELESLAKTDPLTGLLNRRSFSELASQDRRHGDKPMLGCIMLDIDHFKKINDTFGHAAGDAVLATVGKFIQSIMGPHDHAFRWGGEEFVILRPSSGLGESYVWAENIRRDLANLSLDIEGTDPNFHVTPSIGVETVTNRDFGQSVIDHADRAMYLAKTAGRNQVCTWPMVAVADALEQSSTHGEASVAEKRNSFLAKCDHSLSSVQREHVTVHCEEVSRLSARIARVLRMPEQTVERLRFAGLLHDVGKCLIPSDLLEKPSALTSDERKVIDLLPHESAKLSRNLGADLETTETIERQHRADDQSGSGTDNADAITPMTSVLWAADAFVALTTDRPYRQKTSPASARDELESQHGKHLDPAIFVALTDATNGSFT